MITDTHTLELWGNLQKQISMIKNIELNIEKDKFVFTRISGRYLFSTNDIDTAYAYVLGISAERVGLDG